jgi:PAS domain S-box-containing protein
MDTYTQDSQPGKYRRFVMPVVFAGATTAVVAVAIYYALSAFLFHEAEDKIRNVLFSHRGLHQYIQTVMHPAFFKARDDGFVSPGYYSPEMFSSTYIVRTMHGFYNDEMKKAGLPEVYYKMASVNPRNPVNRADAFEASLLRLFNENRGVHEFRQVINVDGKNYLYYAMPFMETTTRCLKCHGKREDAPPGLRALYPGEGGFNEKTGVYRAIESIRMPINDVISTALVMTCSLSGGIAVMFVLFIFNRRLKTVVSEKTSSLEAEIAERRQAEEALRKSEEAYRTVADFTYDWEYWLAPDGSLRYISPSCERHTGYSADQFLHDPGLLFRITHPDDRDELASHLPDQPDAAQKHTIDFRITTKSGEECWFSHVCQPVYDSAGNYLGQRASNKDITEQRRSDEELQRNEARFRSLANILQHPVTSIQEFLDYALDEAIVLTESRFGYIYFYHENLRQFVLNFWSKQVMEACTIANPANCYDLDKTGIWDEAVRQRRPIMHNDFQAEHPLKKGCPEEHAPLHRYLAVPVFSGDEIVAVVAVANKAGAYDEIDVRQLQLLMGAVWECVERKRAEEAVRNALAEKETLIRELYHRTKNNLQIVRSLMTLQAGNAEGAETRAIVREMDNRIQGLALIHEMLYQSGDLSSLDLTEYLDNLVALVVRNFWGHQPTVSVDVSGEPLPVTLDIASPCGLVINELLSNTFKYAFPGGGRGVITIRLRRDGPGHILLEYADNGVGLPEGFDPQSQKTLGMQSLFAIVEQQLRGEVRIVNGDGLGFILRVATGHYEERV